MIFNGKELLATVGAGISINKEIPPMGIGRNLVTLDGSRRIYLGNSGIASKTYTLRLNIYGGSMANAWAMRRKVSAWAYSDGEAPLIPTHQPDIYYSAVCQSVGDPTFVFGACTVDVVFLIPNPYAHAVTMLTPTGSDSLTFTNGGSADPIVRLTATPTESLTAPTVLVNGLPAFVGLGSVESGVPLVIDFENRTYKVNSLYANEKINYLLTDWCPGWVTGENTIAMEGANLSAEVVQRWL